MMSSSVTLRPGVLAAKQWLAHQRAKLKHQHDGGSPGIQVCSHLADIWDHVVLGIYEAALADFSPADRKPWQVKPPWLPTAATAGAKWRRTPMST